ncbi:MAG: hypothetical protein DRQ65_00730 [Gammaproteobacteria bacterium]|nr:MAG: hypothetical protein DRQ98_06425 [Gammaproteobacteria bacterium]RLA57811.1 MAG: hypothetical protein DRQ65_00730 [Gammaproteobacteria bacterium]
MAMMGRSFKEILLLLLCAIPAGAVMPFAIMRFRHEQWPAALLDASFVCVLLGLFLHVYFTRETRVPGVVLSLIFMVATLGSIYLLGNGQIYWAFPALTVAFYLLETRYAALLSALSLLAIEAMLWSSTPAATMLTITLTLLTSMLCAYSFAATVNRQRTRLKHLATIDPLTGTGNRRAQNEKLDAVNALFRRAQIPGSILILDIDYFKKINDTYGHIVGDDVLIEMADLIRANTRPTETLYRYGGEEFIVIAEHTDLEGAAQLAEKLRLCIEQKTFVSGIRLTTSFGVAELHRGEGRQGWLGRADEALFRAKNNGRNRVVQGAPAKITLLPQVATAGERT